MYIYNRMIIFRLTWIIALLFIITGCSSVGLSPPKKIPLAASKKEQQLLLLGEQYFKQGQFQTALQKVQQAHALNPDNEEALYAIARCYLSLKKYSQSLEYSRRAASYRSEHLPDIYLLMGRTYQQLDDPWNALRTYRYATGQYPKNLKLQYALGETYVYLDKLEFASDAFKAAITATRDDAASHYQLGVLYYTNHYSTPALLSLSVSLLLEPGHARAASIRQNIVNLLASDLQSKNTDEGDFRAVAAALNRQRVSMLKSEKKYTVFEIIKAQYLRLYKELDTQNIKNQQKTFVIDTYVSFYNKLNQQGLAETSVYYLFQNSQDEVINRWLENNSEKVKRLETFVKNGNKQMNKS